MSEIFNAMYFPEKLNERQPCMKQDPCLPNEHKFKKRYFSAVKRKIWECYKCGMRKLP